MNIVLVLQSATNYRAVVKFSMLLATKQNKKQQLCILFLLLCYSLSCYVNNKILSQRNVLFCDKLNIQLKLIKHTWLTFHLF